MNERAAALFSAYSTRRPQDALALAEFYGRQGRHAESLDVLEKEWSAARPEQIVATVSTLHSSAAATNENYDRAEKVLVSALDEKSRALPLVLGYADLQNWRERYDDAERLYREALGKEPRHAAALNNLALLLALRGQGGPEPMALIEKSR